MRQYFPAILLFTNSFPNSWLFWSMLEEMGPKKQRARSLGPSNQGALGLGPSKQGALGLAPRG